MLWDVLGWYWLMNNRHAYYYEDSVLYKK
jgi:hypothetical protein